MFPSPRTASGSWRWGALTERYAAWIAKKGITKPDDWLFPQDEDRTKPMWDSGVRKALKLAAQACKPEDADDDDPGLDFPGFGMHSFRRANITMRQEVGGSAIEASKIAGHANVSMTGEYTKVQLKRQDELTRAIQERIEVARKKQEEKTNAERDAA